MPIYKLLISLIALGLLVGCGQMEKWDWFSTEQEEVVYEEPEEEVIEEDFDDFEDEMMEDEYANGDEAYEEDLEDEMMGDEYANGDEVYEEDSEDIIAPPKRTVIHFNYKKTRVSEKGMEMLERHADYLKKLEYAILTIEGHTDTVASEEYNKKLGLARAQMVADLLEEMGVEPSQIVIISYGEEHPIKNGNSEKANAMNRRVELVY